MNFCDSAAIRAFAPALVGWCLTSAACLRLEQLRDDLRAQAVLPILQGGALVLLVVTLACICVASVVLWKAGRDEAPMASAPLAVLQGNEQRSPDGMDVLPID